LFSVIFSGELREMKSKKIKTHYTLQKFYREPCFGLGLPVGLPVRATPDTLLIIHLLELMMVRIEQGVTVPTNRSKYPFGDMEPGDSILFGMAKQAQSCRVAALRFTRMHQPTWVFTLRKVDGGWRLWRIS
jgi:hypothetical protein